MGNLLTTEEYLKRLFYKRLASGLYDIGEEREDPYTYRFITVEEAQRLEKSPHCSICQDEFHENILVLLESDNRFFHAFYHKRCVMRLMKYGADERNHGQAN